MKKYFSHFFVVCFQCWWNKGQLMMMRVFWVSNLAEKCTSPDDLQLWSTSRPHSLLRSINLRTHFNELERREKIIIENDAQSVADHFATCRCLFSLSLAPSSIDCLGYYIAAFVAFVKNFRAQREKKTGLNAADFIFISKLVFNDQAFNIITRELIGFEFDGKNLTFYW